MIRGAAALGIPTRTLLVGFAIPTSFLLCFAFFWRCHGDIHHRTSSCSG